MSAIKTFVRVLPWWLLAAGRVRAYTTFHPVCELPAASVNFVWAPDARGTLEILWSSLFTLIACTWTIHHPNIPEQRDGRNPGWWGDLHWGFRSAVESAKLTLVTVLAPELIISVAWDQSRIAKKVERELRDLARIDEVPWTIVHGHYVAMGGFVVRSQTLRAECEREGAPYHLTADDVIFLRKRNYLRRLPNLTSDEINDKSKTDPLLKFLAICQILWSVIQIATREIKGLPITLLELNVLALAACAIFIYGLCWHKPKHVKVATTIECEIPDVARETLEQPEMSAAWVILFDTIEQLQIIRTTRPPRGAPLCNTRVQFDEEKSGKEEKVGVAASLFLAATLFGAVHMAGWNLDFPTQAERIIWRFAILYILTLPCLIFLLHFVGQVLLCKIIGLAEERVHSLFGIGGTLLSWLYLGVRVFILIETVRTFVSLPPKVFISTWTANFPHFS